MDNFKIIYKILRYLESAMDYEECDVNAISHERYNISYPRWEQLMIILSDEGYIKGIITTQDLESNCRYIVQPICPRITLKGLEYLSDNTFMKKAANIVKGIKETIPGA